MVKLDDQEIKKSSKIDITGAADLERVTDYAEEKEISEQHVQNAIDIIGNLRSKEEERLEKLKEVAKFKCKKEDIELIVKEMEINKSKAEQKLREHNGNVVDALIELTD